mmetsp:Transcript_8887/g.13725  ORF Transcript_8887/g.13725 Transcript_8887/m.13725 type:complete len:418 (+) Transcript_8887:149-1402(+)|eukprot:CAMPEP_0202714000 /NCGR_PEP_ID=MMETSP1385-20130828/62266_1 /ASSEMBLY_ACC=CAM_ASM_000861 /TAXON_ID=933848 /ORGANISM="Elphidium margaritaceum" /LENGTH=417 /DNA_ID=CAMNT_0049374561 /DNA_START=135 /DNA_END=1388 /DNA_ORIENTATION=-
MNDKLRDKLYVNGLRLPLPFQSNTFLLPVPSTSTVAPSTAPSTPCASSGINSTPITSVDNCFVIFEPNSDRVRKQQPCTAPIVVGTTYDVKHAMTRRGYDLSMSETAMARTLQGSVWRASLTANGFNTDVVVKVTDKRLHQSRATFVHGTAVSVKEDIVSEMQILRYLSLNGQRFGLHHYMTTFVDFFDDEKNFFLVMQNGGTSLFEFVLKAHRYLANGGLCVLEWQQVCKMMFYQMCTCVDILHRAMNVCHLDISLENLLINDVMIMDKIDRQKIHFMPNIHVKFCDFGLAQVFDSKINPNFGCSKFVGKTKYKAPEVYSKTGSFDARSADVWSLGVCLFAMVLGSMPFRKPSQEKDQCFQIVMNGHLPLLIQQWQKSHLINALQLDVLLKIFRPQNQRITIHQLLMHPWFQEKII